MSRIGKRGGKPTLHKDEIHTRRQYVDHSLNFLNWVNQLGFERSLFGRLAYYLESKMSIRRVSLLFIFSLGLSTLLFYDFESLDDYSVGEIATTDIKSPMNLIITDEVATEEQRVKAEKSFPVIFDYELEAYEPIYSRIYKSFRTMRSLVLNTNWPISEVLREEKIKDFLKNKPQFIKEFDRDLPDHLFEWLVVNRFSVRIENILIGAISNWSREKIIDSSDSSLKDEDRQVIVRVVSPVGRGSELNVKMSEIKNKRDSSQFGLESVRGFSRLKDKDKIALTKIAQLLITPNITLNKQEFAERQKKVRSSVLPVQISIKKNQIIVAQGSPIQPRDLTILGEIRNLRSEQRTDFLALCSALLFVVLVLIFFSFMKSYSRDRIRVETRDIVVMSVITTLVVILARVFYFVIDSVMADKFGIPQIAYLVAAPIAAGPMLVGLLIVSAEVVWIFTLLLAVVMAVMTQLNLSLFLATIIGGIAAAQGVFGCTKRNDIYWAGLRTGFVNAFAILLIYIIAHVGEPDLIRGTALSVIGGFIGGVLASFVTMALLPLFESIFSYTTDIKLLELSNLNNPVMQAMMMKSPGTYHHCMNVGNLSDAAAKDVGANPLLAKVMAYYHDIGKMEHAQYFSENQRPGYNSHDHISPHMSKTILIAHVKDGAEMAIKHKLGKPIVDGILQHHGTTLISFFYNKALEEQDVDVTGAVEESEFRYPGPKPQFKEAAIVMLADSIEATARSLEEPTHGRLNSIVENIIESKFMDGQLDECNLSIRDLAVMKDTFKRILVAMYHHRLDYPHMHDGKLVAVGEIKKKATGHQR